MKINTIILDVDDLLNTCTASIAELFGVRLKQLDDLSWFDPVFGWDIVKAVSHAIGCPPDEPMCVKKFWNAVPSEFWETIPKSAICDELVQHCASLVGEENVIIGTSCTLDSMSYGYKHKWLVQNLPKYLHRQFHITPIKERLSAAGTLLIDDRWENCCKAADRHGDYICWPKPWNPLSRLYPNAYGYLFNELSKREF